MTLFEEKLNEMQTVHTTYVILASNGAEDMAGIALAKYQRLARELSAWVAKLEEKAGGDCEWEL